MAVRFSDEQVLEATGGKKLRSGARASYSFVSTDTRTLEPGCLFVALKGERFDGHAFLAEAAKKGAGGALVAQAAPIPALPEGFALFEVADTLGALGALARFHRLRFKGKVVAVGGSNGKTTTKELVGAVLAAHGPSLKTEGNLNNEIGVPLTLFKLEPQQKTAVIEMGMNHPGEMARLTEIVQPDVALLTVIQPEHLEGLGSLEGVAEAEGELFRNLRAEAIAVVNQDDPHIVAQAKRSSAMQITFGRAASAQVRLTAYVSRGGEGSTIRVQSREQEHEIRLGLVGEHNAMNAAAAFAVGQALGFSAETTIHGLESAKAHERRLNVVSAPGGITVLDDCYNANPGSMGAALEVLRDLAKQGSGGRAQAILGDMLELGAQENEAHRALGEQTARMAQRAAFFGPRSAHAFEAARAKGLQTAHFLDLPKLMEWLRQDLKSGDVVLVKGSRGMRLERAVEALTGKSAGGGH